ncbi:MAG: hypothetical protein GF364_10675 [Candidatus Lokiarchaeota archaeon]|nr:hypothetical protein [Candidatus Lokiarchaeota archaeon]
MKIFANFYQQFDADYTLSVPAEGYTGWVKKEIEINPEKTALVVMHAWDCGTRDEYPGWYRFVEYIPRAQEIAREIFPRLLNSVRNSSMKLLHVVGSGDYYKKYSGYKIAKKFGKKYRNKFTLKKIKKDGLRKRLDDIRGEFTRGGEHNQADIRQGFKNLDFMREAKPIGDEPIAKDSAQLFGLCKRYGINHLIYVGFAINWCLLLSPGGMVEMSKHGLLCSTIREAVTAVENKKTAREETCKEIALWRIALSFGLVFDLEDFLTSIERTLPE